MPANNGCTVSLDLEVHDKRRGCGAPEGEHVMRKIFMGASAITLLSLPAVGVLGGTAGAAAPPVGLTGSVSCSFSGHLKFAPAITNSPSSSTISVGAKLGSCSYVGTAGVTVSSGTLTAVATAPATLSCGELLSAKSLPTMTGSIKWAASGAKALTTPVTITGASAFLNLSGPAANFASLYFPTTIGSGGSFASDTVTIANVLSNSTDTVIAPKCAPGRPGLRGLTFGKSSGAITGTISITGGV